MTLAEWLSVTIPFTLSALCNNLILNWIVFSAENALTLAEWLSVTIHLTQSPISLRLSMLPLIFSASHSPLNVTYVLAWLACGMAWTTEGADCFNRTTINATIPLYIFPSLSAREWYWRTPCLPAILVGDFQRLNTITKMGIFVIVFSLWKYIGTVPNTTPSGTVYKNLKYLFISYKSLLLKKKSLYTFIQKLDEV